MVFLSKNLQALRSKEENPYQHLMLFTSKPAKNLRRIIRSSAGVHTIKPDPESFWEGLETAEEDEETTSSCSGVEDGKKVAEQSHSDDGGDSPRRPLTPEA